jgi:hypothetical protein
MVGLLPAEGPAKGNNESRCQLDIYSVDASPARKVRTRSTLCDVGLVMDVAMVVGISISIASRQANTLFIVPEQHPSAGPIPTPTPPPCASGPVLCATDRPSSEQRYDVHSDSYSSSYPSSYPSSDDHDDEDEEAKLE